MLNLSSSEIRIVKAWSEKAESSPFPQEKSVVNRLKRNFSDRQMSFSLKELQVILHWAEQDSKGRYGTGQYLLDHEEKLLARIESYVNSEMDGL